MEMKKAGRNVRLLILSPHPSVLISGPANEAHLVLGEERGV